MRHLPNALCLVLVVVCFSSAPSWAARCTGSAACRACKNCRYCKHCAQEGGTCGVCAVAYRPAPRSAPAAPLPTPGPKRVYVTERVPVKPTRRPASPGKVETYNGTVWRVFRTPEGDVLETVGGNFRVTYTSCAFSYPSTPFSILLTRRYGKRWNLYIEDGNPGGAIVYVERIGR